MTQNITELAYDREKQKAEIAALAATYDESTGLSWLWAFLFGPLWALYIGNLKYAVIMFVLNLVLIGFVLNPFLAYAAHRDRAQRKAEDLLNMKSVINS